MRWVFPENIAEIETLASIISESVGIIKQQIDTSKIELDMMAHENERMRELAYNAQIQDGPGIYNMYEPLSVMMCEGYECGDYNCASTYIHSTYTLTDKGQRSLTGFIKALSDKETELHEFKIGCESQIKKLGE